MTREIASFYVKINHYLPASRVSLAGKDKSFFQLFGFQCIIVCHVYFSNNKLCPASAAYPSLAGKWEIDSLRYGRIQDRTGVISQIKIERNPILLNGNLTDLPFSFLYSWIG